MYLRAEIAKGVRSLTEIKCSIGHSWDKVHKNKSYFILSLLSFDSMSAQMLLIQVGVWVRTFGRTLDKNHPVVKGELKTCFQFTGSVQVLQEMLLTQGLTRLLLLWKSFLLPCVCSVYQSLLDKCPSNGSFSLLSWKKYCSREILGSVQSLTWFLKNLMQQR